MLFRNQPSLRSWWIWWRVTELQISPPKKKKLLSQSPQNTVIGEDRVILKMSHHHVLFALLLQLSLCLLCHQPQCHHFQWSLTDHHVLELITVVILPSTYLESRQTHITTNLMMPIFKKSLLNTLLFLNYICKLTKIMPLCPFYLHAGACRWAKSRKEIYCGTNPHSMYPNFLFW